MQGWALQQLWLFWIAPVIGAALAGLVYPWVASEPAGDAGRQDALKVSQQLAD